MKKIGRMLAALLTAVLLCTAMGVLFAACGEGTEEPPQTDPVKVADGIDFDLAVGAEREFAVADYITANGNTVSASSAEETVASAAVEGGTLTVSALSAGETTVTLTCGEVTVTFGVTVYERKAPVKVADGIDFDLAVGAEREFAVADYITANGNTVSASSAEETVASAAVEGGTLTVSALSAGETTVTLTCGDVTVTFGVTVYERKAPVKVKDGEAIEIAFGGSERRNVADYITTYGNTVSVSSKEAGTATAEVADGVLTIAAVSSGKTTVTLTCGDVTVTFTVTVALPEVEAPVFENGAISFDLFETGSGSYTFGITAPEGVSYTYAYSLAEQDGNAQISDGALTYTATEPVSKVLTVNVTATATVSGETIEKQGSFTVTITVTDTTPAVIESAIAADGTVDLYDHADGYTIDLTANIENAGNVTSYTVAVGDEEAAPVENAEEYVFTGSYSDTAQQVTLTVTALFGEKSVSYTYTLSVIDSTAYRLYNGGFDLDLDGWTLDGMMDGEENDAALGGISEATGYWENETVPPVFNNDGKFFSAYAYTPGETERATGTLCSSNFIIGGSGWITYKLGGAKNIEQVYLEVVSADRAKRVKLPNFDWSNNAGSLVRGCTLVSYRADLIEYGFTRGEEVYLLLTDNGNSTGDYGLFFLDSVVTYYPVGSEPDDSFNLVSKYRLYNGGFETGSLMGWELTGDIGVVSQDSTYWNNPDHVYGKEGEYLFTWWSWDAQANDGAGAEVKREGNTGTLKSRVFTLKKDAIVSFLFGGGGGNQNIYLEFVNAETDEVLAKFFNTSPSDGRLVKYWYKFAEVSEDTQCYIRVTDNAASGWGCFALDGVETNLAAKPDGYNLAVNQLSADV